MREPKLLVVIDTTSAPLNPQSNARDMKARSNRLLAVQRVMDPPPNWELVYIPAAKRLKGGGTWHEVVRTTRSELTGRPPIAKIVIISKSDKATATRLICEIIIGCSFWTGMYHLPYSDLV